MSSASSAAAAARVVVKVGSSSITSAAGGLDQRRIDALVDSLSATRAGGREVVLVSSGAIASGLAPLSLGKRPRDLATQQAAASVGQGILVHRYTESFARHGLTVGQVLLTADDVVRRGHYRNAQRTLYRLLEMGVVPVVNENDTVATEEIRFGDNDRLAALVAHLVHADLLVLLSDVDGLYDAPPRPEAPANLIALVERITPEIEAMAGASGSELSRGGMTTKIEAGKIATTGGIHMVIAPGRIMHPLRAVAEGGRCTWFLTPANPVTARKKWIAGSLEPKGTLTVDAGAVAALRRGNSLLPVGIIKVEGAFARGDAVIVRGPDGSEIGRGLVAYDAEDAEKIRGKSSSDVLLILGIEGRAEMVHRDDLVMGHA
jgi:glutamate 5-kinase